MNRLYVDFVARIIVMAAMAVLLLEMYGVVQDTLSVSHPRVHYAILAVVSIAFVYLATGRDAYLPFLGTTVMPTALLQPTPAPGNGPRVEIKVRPGVTRVVWWAASAPSASASILGPKAAYGDYSNSGVVAAKEGVASIVLKECPQEYTVRGKQLSKHVHYREVLEDGLLSPVKTAKLTC